MLHISIYSAIFIYLFSSCSDIEHVKNHYPADQEIVSSNGLTSFASKNLNFSLLDHKDSNDILNIYMQSQKDNKFYFGKVYDESKTKNSITYHVNNNYDFLASKNWQEITWKINLNHDMYNIKRSKIIGTISMQKFGSDAAFGMPDRYWDMIKDKSPVNMALFFSTQAQGKGFGTEACRALVVQIFRNSDAKAIVNVSNVNNEASKKSALKCGFKYIGEFFNDYAGEKYNLLIKEKTQH